MNKEGLSGIKFITVLAITSVWIFIAIPVLCHYSIEANETQALTKIQELTAACEKFKTQYDKYPNDLEVLTKFIKEDLVSPGYHYEYESLNGDSFVLVALPNNPLTGNNGYYGDDGNTIITVPNVSTAPGAGHSIPGIRDNMIRRLQKEKGKEKAEKEAVLTQPTVYTAQPAISPPKLTVTKENIRDVGENKKVPIVQAIKDNPPVLTKPEPIIISSTVSSKLKSTYPGPFEKLVCSSEGLSSASVRSISLTKDDKEVSNSLAGKSIRDDVSSLVVSKTEGISSANNNVTITIEKTRDGKEEKSRGR